MPVCVRPKGRTEYYGHMQNQVNSTPCVARVRFDRLGKFFFLCHIQNLNEAKPEEQA